MQYVVLKQQHKKDLIHASLDAPKEDQQTSIRKKLLVGRIPGPMYALSLTLARTSKNSSLASRVLMRCCKAPDRLVGR